MRGYRVFDTVEKKYSDKEFFISKDGKLYIKDGIQLKKVDTDRYLVEDSTGLTDKNDKMIFDGDIDLEYGVVKWSDNYGGWFCFKDGEERPLYDYPLFEVVGTIHDNPELEVTQ